MNKYLKISIKTTFLLCVTMLTVWQSMGQGSLYTGQAPIGIPLYTMSDGKTQIPIGLNYNASGIKPNEHPGWVGQNWNLQAGGFVARKINGLPDDMKADFKVPIQNGRTIRVDGFYFSNTNQNRSDWDSTAVLKDLLVNGYDRYMQLLKSDTAPDEFFFSLPSGVMGSFLLNESRQWIFKGNKVMKVELLGFLKAPFKGFDAIYPNPELQDAFSYDCIKDNQSNVCTKIVRKYTETFKGFVVTDDSGTQYTFGGDSTSISYSIPFLQQYHTHWKADVWHLTKIKPVGGQEITLKYEEYNEKFSGKTVGGKFNINMFITAQKGGDCISGSCTQANIDTAKIYSGELVRPVYLKKIESIRDSVIFTKSRSVELEYPKKVFSGHYNSWKQYVRFYQQSYNLLGQQITYTSPDSKPWSPNTQNENWNTTDSLEKYLNDMSWVKLDRIKVYSKVSGETHAEIEYILKYNNSNKNYTYQTVGDKIQRSGSFGERIRLDTIAQIAGTKSLVYKMDYYNNDTIPQPSYFDSNGLVDHWGFLNRRKYKVTDANYYDKRESTKSIEIARIGTLKSITLPTGGKTIYDFEQNTYSKIYDMGLVKRKVTLNKEPDYGFGTPLRLEDCRRRGKQLFLVNSFYNAEKNFINAKYGSYKLLAFKESKNKSENNILNVRVDTSSYAISLPEVVGAFIDKTGLYIDSVKIDTVGGLRIKAIKSVDNNGFFIGRTTYSYDENYTKPNTLSSSGILDYRYLYEFEEIWGNWKGNRYIINSNTTTSYDTPTNGYSSGIFFASNGSYNSPVTYSEVTERRFDNSYTTYHFSNYYSKIGGEHMDDIIPKSSGISGDIFQPTIDKSFERGRVIMVESFRSDGKQVAKSTVKYTNINQNFIKSVGLNSSYGGFSTSTNYSILNIFINIAVEVAIGFATAGFGTLAQSVISFTNPTSKVFPISSTDAIMHFNEYAYPQKIYTYNYETSSDSSWTFDYTDPTKKFITANYYKYNSLGQLRELKRVQNDGLELLTNNKMVSDYDFDAAYQAFLVSGDFTSCTNQRTSCDASCATELDPQVQDYCYRSCQNDEFSCKQNLFSASLAANPTSNNLLKMQMRNMLSYPVESTVKRKNINSTTYKVLGGTLNLYGEFAANNTFLYAPQSILKMKQTQTNATSDTSKLDASGAFVYDQTRYTVKTFDTSPGNGYGIYGNLTFYTGRDGIKNTMQHDPMNYPISKNIGTYYGGNEFYSTMEYAPILGMIKTADQNNRKIRNRYDEFNRLRSVSKTLNEGGTDNDYLLKLYDYHYFNDNSDITISDFVVGGCNGDSPASCTLRATLVPNSFMEMKVGSSIATTITGSFEEGVNTVTDPAKYTWTNPAGTLTTAAAFTIPALTTANLNSVLGTYYYKVEKGGCQSCMKFTISKKTTATDPDLLAEEDK